MWISSKNGRKQNKENSVDKIKQFIKLTQKSSFSSSLVKSSSIPSGICLFQQRRLRQNKENIFNNSGIKTKTNESKTSNTSNSVLIPKIGILRNEPSDQLSSKTWMNHKIQKILKPYETTQNEFDDYYEDYPYFIECMSKKHKLLSEMQIHMNNSILTFRQFLKGCRNMPSKMQLSKVLPQTAGRKTVVFDMDQTLIHTSETQTPNYQIKVPFRSYQGKIKYGFVNVRPYAKQLLKRLSKNFDIIIFTASSPGYADPILDYIDQDKVIKMRLYREHCTLVKNQLFVKDLRILKRNLENVVLVDNAPYSYLMQLQNGIPILPYYKGSDDRQLQKLEKYLMDMKNIDDVRLRNMEYFGLHEYIKYSNYQSIIEKVYSKWQKIIK